MSSRNPNAAKAAAQRRNGKRSLTYAGPTPLNAGALCAKSVLLFAIFRGTGATRALRRGIRNILPPSPAVDSAAADTARLAPLSVIGAGSG